MISDRVDFYSSKGTALPRFVYRHLLSALQKQTDSQSRAEVISEFLATLDQYAMKGDFLKFKWALPTRLSEVLTPSERALLDGRLSQLRHRTAKKLFDVYPHCSDEFSLDPAFIDAAFDASPVPL